MKFSKQFYILLSILISLLVCRITYADTCYDPNYDSYYDCTGDDEYIAPVEAGVLFGAVISNDNGYYNHEHYNNGYYNDNHGYYNNENHEGSRGGYGRGR